MSVQQDIETLGDYLLVKPLGEGMLGKVYLAQHRFLKKSFALKVLPDSLSRNKEFIERFEKEIALIGTLDHPHIVKIHNISCAEGKYFLACDPVVDSEGQSQNLLQYIEEKGQLSEEEIFTIAKQIAQALDYTHGKNFGDEPLAHRGLKFNNILLVPNKETLQVKVTDFGLTRIVGIGAVLAKTYQKIWERMAFKAGLDADEEGDIGTLRDSFYQHFAFLAPEQKGRGGSSWDVDAKADIYAFGVILYYLLVGVFPEGFFPMPSECNLSLKMDWDSLVKQCLNVDPEKRPEKLLPFLNKMEKREEGLRPKIKPQEIQRPEYEPDPAAIFNIDKKVAIFTPKKPEHKEIAPSLTEMVVIEGGTFLRGSHNGARDEMPRHAVNLSSFAIDIHPVMNEQFVLFLAAMGGEKDADNHEMIRLRDSRIRKNGGRLNIESGYAKHPVVGVTWYGAIAYAKWIGKRLPTEAEWEISACGGLEGGQFPTGDDIERTQANFFSSDTTAVMSYPPNGFGLYDIAGNVYEWCMDWYGYHYYETSLQEPDNPKGPPQGVYRVLRGGCWKSLKEDMRVSHRHRNNPGVMNGTYGFRCATDVS